MVAGNNKDANNGPYRYSTKDVKNVEKGMTPELNSEYFDNGFKYRTDGQGRTVLEEGWLKKESAERNLNAQKKMGGDGYDAGHGIKSSSGGSGEAINLTKMKTDLNRYGKARFGELSDEQKDGINKGEDTQYFNVENFRDMERFIDHETKNGKDVYFQKSNHYDGNSDTPDRYDVNITTKDENGTTHNRSYTFYNTDKEGRIKQRDEAKEANRNAVGSEQREAEKRTEQWKEHYRKQGEQVEDDKSDGEKGKAENKESTSEKTDRSKHTEKSEKVAEIMRNDKNDQSSRDHSKETAAVMRGSSTSAQDSGQSSGRRQGQGQSSGTSAQGGEQGSGQNSGSSSSSQGSGQGSGGSSGGSSSQSSGQGSGQSSSR